MWSSRYTFDPSLLGAVKCLVLTRARDVRTKKIDANTVNETSGNGPHYKDVDSDRTLKACKMRYYWKHWSTESKQIVHAT